jgi:hypothetical protein
MKTSDLDPSRSMLDQLRERHPISLGQIIDGKRVRMTCYEYDPKTDEHVSVYQLEGESRTRRAP